MVPGVYELIDIAKCDVREQFLTYPGTVYPGFFGVDAAGQPLALDCFCQPPATTVLSTTAFTSTGATTGTTTPAATTTVATTSAATSASTTETTTSISSFPTTTPSSYCLNVTLPCDGNGQGGGASVRADTNGVYCIPTANSTLFLRIGCNTFGTGFDAWSCPFGCDDVCQEDPAISTSLGLGAFLGRLSGPGFCAPGGLFPLLPDPAQMRCIPGLCVTRTIAISTTSESTTEPSITTVDTSAGTTSPVIVTTAPVTTAPQGCLSVRPGCAPPGAELSDLTTGVYCSVISLPEQQYSLRLTCVVSGELQVQLCDVTDCARNCTSSPVILALLGLQTTNTSVPGVCATTNAAIPGVATANAFLTCFPSCVFPTSTSAAPSTSTAAPTAPPTTLPPVTVPTNQVPPVVDLFNQQPPLVRSPQANDDTDLLAIIGVPSAVLAATILLFAAQRDRLPTPQYYSQGI